MTQDEYDRACDLIYDISPVEGTPRLPDDWTTDETILAWTVIAGGVVDGHSCLARFRD